MKKSTLVAALAAGLFLFGACGSPSATNDNSGGGNTSDGDTIKIGGNFELSDRKSVV